MADGSREYPKLNLTIPDATPVPDGAFRPSYRVHSDDNSVDYGSNEDDGPPVTRVPSGVGVPLQPNAPPGFTSNVDVTPGYRNVPNIDLRAVYSKKIPL